MTNSTPSPTGSGSPAPAVVRSFDELEQQLRDLRRSLGMDASPEPSMPVATDAATVTTPAPAPAPGPAPAPAPGPEDDDAHRDDDGLATRTIRSEEEPAAVPQARSSVAPIERPRRGLGMDLVLLAGAWAGLIGLVVRLLGQAS